jgi:putative phage-type endonuclease
MPVIDLIQGSEKWLKYRQSRLMATDVPVVLGSNPWRTKIELFEEKLGLRPPVQLNAAMERGQKLEPEARKLASELLGIEFEPIVMESTRFPWLASSLDGISSCGKYILEIKCLSERSHEAAIDDIIPPYYIDQILTQLEVTKANICYYFSYRPEYTGKPYAIIPVYPNREKQAEIIAKGSDFYFNHLCVMNPPEDWKLKERK